MLFIFCIGAYVFLEQARTRKISWGCVLIPKKFKTVCEATISLERLFRRGNPPLPFGSAIFCFSQSCFMTLPEVFRPIYIISGIWQGAGWASIMYTASLSNASKDLKEAAMIDGANLIQQIMTVEWPAIKDMVVIQFILQAGNIMSIGFEKAYALQTDLNLNTAEIIATYVYKKGLLDGDYSFSTAVGLFNTIVNVILLIAVNKIVAKMNDGKGL